MKGLSNVGAGWEFCHLPKDEFPGAGSGKCWNPVTGCINDYACRTPDGEIYCYMHSQAKRFPETHKPEYRFHPDRLEQPLHTKKPSIVAVCTSGDLYSFYRNKVSLDLIKKLFDNIADARNHYYLFLTKYPQNLTYITRSSSWDWYKPGEYLNLGFGTTVTQKEDLWRIDEIRKNNDSRIMKYLVIEPCFFTLEDAKEIDFTGIDWVIIGALTGKNAKQWYPKRETIWSIITQAEFYSAKIYCKTSLDKLFQEQGFVSSSIYKQFPSQIHAWAEANGLI